MNINNKTLVQFSATHGQTAYVSRESMTVNFIMVLSNWNFVSCCYLWNFPFNILVDGKRNRRDERAVLTVLKKGNASADKSTCCPYPQPEFGSQHIHLEIYNICNSFQKIWKPPLISASIYMHAIHINSCRYMHINYKITISPKITQKQYKISPIDHFNNLF